MGAMRLELVDVSTFNRRFRVRLADGAAVEAVHYRGDTLCVSSQVGCAVGCPFCASGENGLMRPLSAEEMWRQVLEVRRVGLDVARTTVSGVGEPLHNHDAVRDFVLQCRSERIAPSLTTSGGPIKRLTEWFALPHNGLTISVHAGTESTRARLVPNAPALVDLFACLNAEVPKLSRSRRKKLALAYLLIEGENDADDEVDAFLERVLPLGATVHLYAYNELAQGAYRGVSRSTYERIYGRMRDGGVLVRMSSQARIESNGGCGTLVAIKRSAAVAEKRTPT